MSDMNRDDIRYDTDVNAAHVSPDNVEGAHDADGTLGRTAGTGAGAIAGGIVGSAAGPIGTIIGAVAGAVLGHAGGDAAHKVGDDHDDVNVETESGGDLGRNAGAGAGAISGAVLGSTVGPVGTVAGAVLGGALGAAGGDAAKDIGGGHTNTVGHSNETPIVDNYNDTTLNDTTVNTGAMNTPAISNVSDRDTMRMPVMEEKLDVQETMQQAGEVQIRKEVITEQVNVPVEVTREEVVITRHAVDHDLAPGETSMGEEVLRVPVMEERVDDSTVNTTNRNI